MDSLLFNRYASLKIQSRKGQFESQAGRPVQVEKDFTGLRIQFQVEKSSEAHSNQARISIYNLSADSRAFVQETGQSLILQAGYAPTGAEKLSEILFSGDVPPGGVRSERKGADWVTTFEVGDGQKKLKEQWFNKSYAPGTSITKAISEVASSLGLAVSSVKGVKEGAFKNGVTLSGSVKSIMDSLTKDGGAEWNIQDGEVQVLGKYQTTNTTAILISPSSGLLDSPIRRAQGVELTTLLIPKFRPGRLVEIQSEAVNGFYKIRKVTFDGDTHEGDWKAKLECIDVRN